MSDEIYPNLQQAEMRARMIHNTEEVRFETGWIQRNALWVHPRMAWNLRYPFVFDEAPSYQPDFDTLRNFVLRHRGKFERFWFRDFTDETPRLRTFGTGDGTTRQFKIMHDWNENVVVYLDGAVYPGVFVDAETGWVLFDVAPADGVLLSYDADECRFRTRFAEDVWTHDRFKWTGMGGTLALEQIYDVEDNYPISQEIYGGAGHEETLDAVGEAVGYSFACPVAVTVTNLYYYHINTVGNPGQVRVSLYTNIDGAPGVQLVTATHTPAAAPPAGTWIALACAATDLTQNTRYWMVIEADAGLWNAGNSRDIRYADGVSAAVWPQDNIAYGAYITQDNFCRNTPHSWLGVSVRSAAGVWGAHDRAARPAFFFNNAGQMMGHCQFGLAEDVFGIVRTRAVVLITTTHDITIDRIGAVFSTAAAPAANLEYRLEVLSDPGVAQRTGILQTPTALGGRAAFMERFLATPFTIAVGDTLYVDFYSPLSIAGAPWTHLGHGDGWSWPGGWVVAWNAITWNGATQNWWRSADGGATWPVQLSAAFTLKCRGWFEG